MTINLHPDASKNFNNKANALLLELTSVPKTQHNMAESTSKPDIFISAHLSEKDVIGEIESSQVDGFGNEVSKYFDAGDLLIGLKEDGYLKLKRLAEDMQRTKALIDSVSITFLTKNIFDWMRKKYKNSTPLSMSEYVLKKCEEGISELEVWVPVAQLHIQSEIKLGKIIFKTITRDLIDSWTAEYKSKNPEHVVNIERYFNEKRKKIQGYATATIKLCAEPNRAWEIAREESEKAISLLRVFSPACFIPQAVSYCTMFGQQNIQSKLYLTFTKDQRPAIVEGFSSLEVQLWQLDNALLAEIMPCLILLDGVLIKDNKTSFQDTSLDALSLYSKSALFKTVEDKLIYILIALEYMLLKNENEPIMQNIGERIAFFITTNSVERKRIVERTKTIYSLRSRFIHHGQSIDDIQKLQDFMSDAWRFFQTLMLNINRFKTKEEFLTKIEEVKFS
ncbi:MAG: HEPN domain-containing protein [Desulfuromonadaceae bacterium]|nr:HEPN domain-containing protein [Desulfuromonadaceae bacterium]